MEEWQIVMVGFVIYLVVVFVYQTFIKDSDMTTQPQSKMRVDVPNVPPNHIMLSLGEFYAKYGKYPHCVPKDINKMITKATLSGEQYIVVSSSDVESIEQNVKNYKAAEYHLHICCARNNNGIACEKGGDIDGAIRNYEENIEDNTTTLHPYERLMVLYRRRQDYDNELRVIDCSIELFEQLAGYDKYVEKWKARREKTLNLKSKLSTNNK